MSVAGYLGSDWGTARYAEARAREAGLSALRAAVVGDIASFKDGWVFRSKLAAENDCSVRTVQRAITQAKGEGLIGVARAAKTEVPPGAKAPIPCGWSHRWTIGRELAGDELRAAIARAKLAQLTRRTLAAPPGVPHAPKQAPAAPRRYTPDELDAELQRLADVAIAATEARARAGPGRHN